MNALVIDGYYSEGYNLYMVITEDVWKDFTKEPIEEGLRTVEEVFLGSIDGKHSEVYMGLSTEIEESNKCELSTSDYDIANNVITDLFDMLDFDEDDLYDSYEDMESTLIKKYNLDEEQCKGMEVEDLFYEILVKKGEE